jgi:hypothetical protein
MSLAENDDRERREKDEGRSQVVSRIPSLRPYHVHRDAFHCCSKRLLRQLEQQPKLHSKGFHRFDREVPTSESKGCSRRGSANRLEREFVGIRLRSGIESNSEHRQELSGRDRTKEREREPYEVHRLLVVFCHSFGVCQIVRTALFSTLILGLAVSSRRSASARSEKSCVFGKGRSAQGSTATRLSVERVQGEDGGRLTSRYGGVRTLQRQS